MAKLEIIEGIGPVYAEKLRAAGVRSVHALLHKGSTPAKRKALEEKTGIAAERILDWVNRADLLRIRGVGEEYSDLLEWAGVDSVPELAQRNPDNLHKRMLEINAEKRAVRRPPSRDMVARWVAQAKTISDVVTGQKITLSDYVVSCDSSVAIFMDEALPGDSTTPPRPPTPPNPPKE
jgi:predicted flap endonuclease-1-like 5' DNA nuclease